MKTKKSKRVRAFYAVAGATHKAIKRVKHIPPGKFVTPNLREALQRLVRVLSRDCPIGALLLVEVPPGMATRMTLDEDGFEMKRRQLKVVGRHMPTVEELRIAATEVQLLGEETFVTIDMQTGQVVPKPEPEAPAPRKLKFTWSTDPVDLQKPGIPVESTPDVVTIDTLARYSELDTRVTSAIFEHHSFEHYLATADNRPFEVRSRVGGSHARRRSRSKRRR